MLFGRYRPLRELGRGGMGVVLLAFDELLGINVALKLVPEALARCMEDLETLRKEVLRGIALTHAGIVRVYSFERDPTTAAIVMEYVEGESLAELKARQPEGCFDTCDLRRWLEQLCAALDYAHHDARIAHRDLKPRNLILTRDGRLKVADFGIASSLSETTNGVSMRRDASGTPPYMSPQQAMGERPTSADDIYSLGATVFDLLTGKPPFFRGNILAQVIHEPPPRMAERRREFGVVCKRPIPESWEQTVAACLAKDPRGRPANGAAFLRMLTESAPRTLKPALQKPVPPLEIAAPAARISVEQPVVGATIPMVPLARWKSPKRTVATKALAWPRTLLRVVIAAALCAGAIYAARHRPRSDREERTGPGAGSPPAAAAQPAPAARVLSNERLRENRPPASSLRTGNLERPAGPPPPGRRRPPPPVRN
jgi:serine/threonine protein kinase